LPSLQELVATILEARSPQSHKKARRRDEELMAVIHGKNAAGTSSKVREINDRLLGRNATNVQSIQEQQARALAALTGGK